MFTVALHGEGNAGDQCQCLTAGMKEVALFKISRQFFVCLEILSVLTMVPDILQHRYGLVESLVTPTLWCGDMPQVSKTVTVVLTVLVVEVFLQGGDLLLVEVVVLYEVIAAQCLGIDGDSFLCHPLHLCLLLWGQEQPTGIDHDGIIVFETAHLLSLYTIHLDLRMVVAQHDVCLLGLQGIHDDNPCGSHIKGIKVKK